MVEDARMTSQMASKPGFIAALDQSGGSTPGALRLYGIEDSRYSRDDDMFRLMHNMRARIMSAPAFTGDKVIGTILFEKTMDGVVGKKPVPSYLWEDRGVVPFLKIDKGLEAEENGVQLMKPISGLNSTLEKAVEKGIFGTKMRSVIADASPAGIAAVVRQQFEIGREILEHGLVPIIEPELSIKSPTKERAEGILLDQLLFELGKLDQDRKVMIKLTIPDVANIYQPLADHGRVLRVVALSGGDSRDQACEKLALNRGMIASFSRALAENLRETMEDAVFDAALERTIDQIFKASAGKA